MLDETLCFIFVLGKGMNPSPLFSYGLIAGQIGLFNLGMATHLGERKLNSNLNVSGYHIQAPIPKRLHLWIHIWSLFNLYQVNAIKIERSNERKWFHTKKKKGKRQTISHRNYSQYSLCRLSSASCKYTCLGQIWSRQQEVLVFTLIQIKQSSCVLIQIMPSPQQLLDKFIYLGSSISSTESDVNIHIGKVWTAINRLLTIWKSDLFDKIKWEFFQAGDMSVLLSDCTTSTLMKHLE